MKRLQECFIQNSCFWILNAMAMLFLQKIDAFLTLNITEIVNFKYRTEEEVCAVKQQNQTTEKCYYLF